MNDSKKSDVNSAGATVTVKLVRSVARLNGDNSATAIVTRGRPKGDFSFAGQASR